MCKKSVDTLSEISFNFFFFFYSVDTRNVDSVYPQTLGKHLYILNTLDTLCYLTIIWSLIIIRRLQEKSLAKLAFYILQIWLGWFFKIFFLNDRYREFEILWKRIKQIYIEILKMDFANFAEMVGSISMGLNFKRNLKCVSRSKRFVWNTNRGFKWEFHHSMHWFLKKCDWSLFKIANRKYSGYLREMFTE